MTAIQDIQRESASNAAARKQTEHLNRFNDKQAPNKNHKQHKNINGEGIQNIGGRLSESKNLLHSQRNSSKLSTNRSWMPTAAS
jgi:hypothetical protein